MKGKHSIKLANNRLQKEEKKKTPTKKNIRILKLETNFKIIKSNKNIVVMFTNML